MVGHTVDVELHEGVNEIRLLVEAVEKIYSFELWVELDTTPPNLEITTPNAISYGDPKIKLEGNCDPGFRVT